MIKRIITSIFKYKIISITAVVIIAAGSYFFFFRGNTAKAAFSLVEYTAAPRDITVAVTGSGAVKAVLSQDITSGQAGKIKSVYFKSGDKVKTGDLVMELDAQNNEVQLERTQLSINEANSALKDVQDNISKLMVKSPFDGQIANITVKEGDSINKGVELATITDTDNLILTVPFNKSQISSIKAGSDAKVYLQEYMQTVDGKVVYISSGGRTVSGGGILYDVKIRIKNPGTLQSGANASVQVGQEFSSSNGTLEYENVKKIKAEVAGTVKSIDINEFDHVKNNQVLIEIENNDLLSQLQSSEIKLKDLQLQFDSQKADLENTKFYALQDGVILNLNVKAGDNAKANDALGTIADYSKMSFEIAVDELDIAKVSAGEEANITIDAFSGQRFKGKVTSVSDIGTTQNGVTTYPVTIEIDNAANGIKEGMNATAEIIVTQKQNVLSLPITAVQRMGRNSFVFVKKDGSENTDSTGNSNINSRMQNMLKNIGKDITMKQIQTGLNNDSDIEVVSGLKEGDKVIVPVQKQSSTSIPSNQNRSLFGGGGQGFGQRVTTVGGNNFRNFNSSSGNNSRTSSSTRTGGGQSARD